MGLICGRLMHIGYNYCRIPGDIAPMPANLTPQYLAAEQRFKDAATMQDKIEALEEMMAVIPKHKGTEKLQAEQRRKLVRFRTQGEKKYGVSKASAMYSVPREGAAQIILLGGTNAGKSSLLADGDILEMHI
jgi:hypothetical protein